MGAAAALGIPCALMFSGGDQFERLGRTLPRERKRVSRSRRVGKGAQATCPPLFRWQPHSGGHASLCPPYGTYNQSSHLQPFGRALPQRVPMLRTEEAEMAEFPGADIGGRDG